MAWDWVELDRGVVAIADPLAVVTNVHLVSERGEALSSMASVLHLNGILHQLPWQHEVGRLLDRLQSTEPVVPHAPPAPRRND